jgi:hypothetical protein
VNLNERERRDWECGVVWERREDWRGDFCFESTFFIFD